MNYYKIPKPRVMWGYYNYSVLHGVEYTRRDAIKAVETHVMRPWSQAKAYMQVRKVVVAVVPA